MLNIDIEYKRGILFVRLDGILNEKTSCILEDALKSVVHKAGIKYVLINFEKLYEVVKPVDQLEEKRRGYWLIDKDGNVYLNVKDLKDYIYSK